MYTTQRVYVLFIAGGNLWRYLLFREQDGLGVCQVKLCPSSEQTDGALEQDSMLL